MKEILVVDDNVECLELVRVLLEREGRKVHCASSGGEALRVMKERNFLLLITDFNMPGVDGLELARNALKIAPQLPIIMITGDLSPEIPRLTLEAGIEKVLAKPFRVETLRNLVDEIARDRHLPPRLLPAETIKPGGNGA